MKNLIMFLVMVCGAFTAYAVDDWAYLACYDAANKELKNQPDTGTRVAFIGNSITYFWGEKHPEFFSDNDFINRAINGQTTYQFLVRFREDIVEIAPVAVVIGGGINDIAENNYAYNEDRTFGNLVSMAEIANANGIEVIMTSILPTGQIYWNDTIANVPDKIESLNARIRAYAEEHSYPYIDYYSEMVYGEERVLNPEYTKDGVHPTEAGYDAMEAIALPVIRSVVRMESDEESAAPQVYGDENGVDDGYYTLQGVRLAGQPASGVYIKRQGRNSVKVVARHELSVEK